MAIGTGSGPPDLEAGIRLAERYPFVLRHRGRASARCVQGRPRRPSRGCASWPRIRRWWPSAKSASIIITISRRATVQRAVFVAPVGDRGRGRQADRDPHARSLGGYARDCSRGRGPVGGIMHCFTGDAAQAREALDLGFHLAFGGVLTFPKAEAVRRGRAHRARRPAAGGNRLPVPGARAASRQAQRAGVRGGNGAPAGGGARADASKRSPRSPPAISSGCVCQAGRLTGKLVELT